MTQDATTVQIGSSERAFRMILLTGFLAGTLDITAAIINASIQHGSTATIVFQYIASGVFGKEAFESPSMVSWGIIFHYTIAYSWTLLFFFVYPKLSILSKNRVMVGLVYGLLIWLAMNFVVLPMSNVRRGTPDAFQIALGISFIMFLVGLPISLLVNKHYSGK